MHRMRRVARVLELAGTVWLSPLGGGTCARVLWQWQMMTIAESRRSVIDEARRLRGERDAAMAEVMALAVMATVEEE